MKIISNKEYNNLIVNDNFWYERWLNLQRETRVVSQKDWNDYQEWLNSPCCETVVSKDGDFGWECPEENRYCSCTHIPYCPECEDDWDETSVIEDIMDAQDTLEDRLDDLECDVRQFISTQKLINKVIEGAINDLDGFSQGCDCCRDGEETVPKQTDKGTERKVKVRVEKGA